MQEQQAIRQTSIDAIELWAMRPTELIALADGPRGEAASSSFMTYMVQQAPEPEEDDAPYEIADGVAVIPVEGVVMRQDEGLFWSTAGLKDIEFALGQALKDPAARAVLFKVYSPGGVAAGVKELGDIISAARAVKPMAAWIDGLGCSAAYWIASATGRVFAGPSATVGSIGVLRRHVSMQKWNQDVGFSVSYVTAGAYKALGNADQNLSDLARKTFQDRVDQIYDMFTADVAQRMGLALEQRDAWADGRDFLAAEAASLGLVTAVVGTIDEAINRLLTETRIMDTNELTTTYPEQVKSLQQEAVAAAMQGREEAIASARTEAVEGVLALAGVVLDETSAQRLRAVVASGMTPAQLEAAKTIFGHAPAEAPQAPKAETKAEAARKEILAGIMGQTPQAVSGSVAGTDDEDSMIRRIGGM